MDNNFSSKIKELRESLNLTQSEFSDSLGVTQAALSAYEKGTRNPTFETIMSISEKYDVSIDWLCGISGKKYINYKTYSDMISELLEILSTKYRVAATDGIGEFSKIKPVPKYKQKHVVKYHSPEKDKKEITFSIEDSNFCDFFTEWIKMKKLNNEGTIDNELYNMWLEKELKKYDRVMELPPFA